MSEISRVVGAPIAAEPGDRAASLPQVETTPGGAGCACSLRSWFPSGPLR